MAIYSVSAPTVMEPETYSIGFDTETWDFCVFKNGQCQAFLSAEKSSELLDEIRKAIFALKPRQ